MLLLLLRLGQLFGRVMTVVQGTIGSIVVWAMVWRAELLGVVVLWKRAARCQPCGQPIAKVRAPFLTVKVPRCRLTGLEY